MTPVKRFCFILMVIYFRSFSAEGVSVQESLFQDAQEAYGRGHFERALEGFQKIAQSGFESGEIYYNIGNCYFKLDQMGKAILFYERANRLLKRDGEVRSNLEFARSRIRDHQASDQGKILLIPFRWMANLFNLWELTLLNVVLGWVLLIGISIQLLALRKGVWVRLAILSLSFLQAYAFISWYIQYRDGARPKGIVLEQEVKVHSGAGESFPESFKVHEGSKVSILEVLGDWAKISLPSGQTGWLELNAYERI